MTAADYDNNLTGATSTPRLLHGIGSRNVTPSDTPLANVALQLTVRGAGDLVVEGMDDVMTTIVLTSVDVPYVHFAAVKTVKAATTAGRIIAFV